MISFGFTSAAARVLGTSIVNPTVSSISPSIGDVLGGTSVTITGTGFVSGASVTIGGTSATSVTVVNSTTITCTTGARSAGTALDVVVTNADTGSGTGTGLFEYFDPAALSTSLLEAGSYTVSGSTGTWAARVGVSPTIASNPPKQVATNTCDIVRSLGTYLSYGVGLDPNTYFGTTSNFCCEAVVIVDSIADTSAEGANEGILANSATHFGLNLRKSGSTYYAHFFVTEAGIKKFARLTLPAGSGRFHLQVRCTAGSALQIRVNGGSWQSGDTCAGMPSLAAAEMQIGRSPGGINPDCRVKMIRIYNDTMSDAVADKYYNWALAKFPMTTVVDLFGWAAKRHYSETYSNGAWTDETGNYNTSQTTSGRRPTATTINGHVALSFDGTDDCLQAGTTTDILGSSGFTLAAVVTTTNTSTYSVIFGKGPYGSYAWTLGKYWGFNTPGSAAATTNGLDAGTANSNGAINDGNPHAVIAVHDGTTLRIYVDGTTAATDTGSAAKGSGTDVITIGATTTTDPHAGVLAYPWAGKIGQVIAIDGPASTEQLSSLMSMLKTWGGIA